MPLLDLPPDLRLDLYRTVLADHQAVRRSTQPSNAHLCLLHTCRLVYYEAADTLRAYLSLRNGFQIQRFHHYLSSSSSSPDTALFVRWADVANDGRVVETFPPGRTSPASQLYRILARLAYLEKLRVFDVRHYHPFTMDVPHLRYRLDFEGAMYPPGVYRESTALPHLISYALYLDPSTPVDPFHRLPSDRVRSLRLSGDFHLPANVSFPVLRHLTIRNAASNSFDRIRFDCAPFAGSRLESFTHAQGHRLAFEIRNVHLESLIDGPGRYLRKLVLLGCCRLSTSVVASCLCNLPTLEYFALSLVTVNELRGNFILALGPSLCTLKLQVIHAWYAVPLFDEERIICDSLEERILFPRSPLDTIHVSFHTSLMTEDGREERWKRIAHARHLTLKIGPWEGEEET